VSLFWILAVLLGLLAAAFVFVPLWREHKRSGSWSATGLVVAVLTIPVAVGLYLHVRTYNPALVSHGDTARLVQKLAAEMRANPNKVQGWVLLGRSYLALGQYANARRAFMEAWNRTPKPDTDLKLALAESMILTDRSQLRGRAADLIDDVLAAEPGNPTALWYGGWAALAQGKQDLARTRWQSLLATHPTQRVADILKQQLTQLGGGAAAAAGSAAAPAGSEAAGGPQIHLKVSVSDKVPLQKLGPKACLFIFARAPGGGPPAAVLRKPLDALPGTFVLSDKSSMIPGRSISDFKELTLVARVSIGCQPLQKSGDYMAAETYKAGDKGTVDLVIDQKVP
jgi:cytochrome c-type biogenesis protein CcmH